MDRLSLWAAHYGNFGSLRRAVGPRRLVVMHTDSSPFLH